MKIDIIESYAGPSTYQITVRGKVDKRYIENFSGMDVSYSHIKEKELSTLTGLVIDQSALCGIVNYLIDNRFHIESIVKISD